MHGNNITFNLDSDFILENLEEKMKIKNISIYQYGFDEKEMDSWMERIAYNTIFYYLSNSPKDIYDIKKMYSWTNKNCININKNLDFRHIGIKLPKMYPNTLEIIKMSYELSETILEGLNYINKLLNEEKFEQSISMMNNILDAFDTIKDSINPILEELLDRTTQNHLVTLEKALEKIVTAYEKYKITNIQEIIQLTLRQHFKELRDEFGFYLLFN